MEGRYAWMLQWHSSAAAWNVQPLPEAEREKIEIEAQNVHDIIVPAKLKLLGRSARANIVSYVRA